MDRDALIKMISSDSSIVAAVLFGSEASGHATQESDIDVALLYDVHKVPSDLDFFQLKMRTRKVFTPISQSSL